MVAAGRRFLPLMVVALLLVVLAGGIILFQDIGIWFPGRDNSEGGFPFPGSNFIFIEKERNRLFLYEGGMPLKYYPVSTGKEPGLTPEGRFKVVRRIENPGGPFGSRWLGLDVPGHEDGLKYGIHGTDEPEKIGQHVSGGCIRMKNNHVEELYERVEEGIPVLIRP